MSKPKRTVPRTCLECNISFLAVKGEVNRGGALTCSRACYYKRQPKILEQKFKDSKMTYASVHHWIKRVKGKALKCEICSTENGLIDWSNISGKYKRDETDWQQLCRKCHIEFDKQADKRKSTLIEKYGTTDILKRNSLGQFISEKIGGYREPESNHRSP